MEKKELEEEEEVEEEKEQEYGGGGIVHCLRIKKHDIRYPDQLWINRQLGYGTVQLWIPCQIGVMPFLIHNRQIIENRAMRATTFNMHHYYI